MREPEFTGRNFLTFDIEEWYHVNYDGIDTSLYRSMPGNLESLVDRMIDICERNRVFTTCFILGEVARKSPAVVRKLHAAGHEIASHGTAHESVHIMGPSAFRTDLDSSCALLEDLCGERVVGFRAPSFSVTREALGWYYAALEERGLRYSSSIFPGQTFLYGIPDFPARPHYPVVNGKPQNILEIPVPRVDLFGKQIGLYIRLFPAWVIRRRIVNDNRAGKPVVIYVHPREIDLAQPRLPLPRKEALIHYWGIRSCERKIDRLLASLPGRFSRIRDI